LFRRSSGTRKSKAIAAHICAFSLTPAGEKWLIGKARPTSVHNLTGISLRTPQYSVGSGVAAKPVKCKMYLYTPSSKTYSNAVDFKYLPNADSCEVRAKINEAAFWSQLRTIAECMAVTIAKS
jgi:hypothetical protein